METRFIVVRRFSAVIHAQLAKGALEANGIEATMNAGLMGTQTARPGTGSIDVMVREEDVPAALQILGPEE
jgi:Putative prokaryotic signal transducing protein